MGSERPENCPVDSFQWRTGGSPGGNLIDSFLNRYEAISTVWSRAYIGCGLRIPPGSPFAYQIRQICPQKGNCEAGRIFLFRDTTKRKNLLTGEDPC